MVGLDKFRAHFSGFADQFVLIGGVATMLVLEDQGLPARATKDLDIVLCVEVLDAAFVSAFWEFVKAGGYQNQQRSTGGKVFYRFDKPTSEGYPAMLELFSRNPDNMVLGEGSHLTPIPVEENVASLSAILLDEDYYRYLHANKRELAGVPVVSEVCLIPLKARAWLDLSARRKAGENVDQKNINKHRNDILRLYQLLRADLRLELPEGIRADMASFLETLEGQGDDVLKTVGIKGITLTDVVWSLRSIYGVEP